MQTLQSKAVYTTHCLLFPDIIHAKLIFYPAMFDVQFKKHIY